MSDINSYNATGRLGADAEVKYTSSGTAIWNARVAVGYGYGQNAGTNWLRVSAFGKRAEGLAKLELRKGSRIGVTGELRVREYDKNDGTKGISVEVNASDIALLDGKPSGQVPARGPAPQQEQDQSAGGGFADDDIPFAAR